VTKDYNKDGEKLPLNSISTGPGPPRLWSNITSVRSQNILWTRLSPCVAFTLLFSFISNKPTSRQPLKESN